MSKNIILIGLMGSGKSTVGKLLSKKLGLIFVDTDKLIEKEAQMSINEIFSNYGEKFFRELESKIIKRVSEKNSQIISTGGGSVINTENFINLKQNGTIFYLKASAEELFNRLKHDSSRPLLKNDDPLKILEELLQQREKFYNQADYKIDTINKDINDIVYEIELLIKKAKI